MGSEQAVGPLSLAAAEASAAAAQILDMEAEAAASKTHHDSIEAAELSEGDTRKKKRQPQPPRQR